MLDYRIWITYDNDVQGIRNDDTHTSFALHQEPEGKNINAKHPVYGGMVAMWYVWKNARKSSYVGFCDIRKTFNVSRLPSKGECQVGRIVDLGSTLYAQYAQYHNAGDMDAMIVLLDKMYGEGNAYTKYIREGRNLIANGSFVMRWADFTKLCRFLFPLLEKFEDGVVSRYKSDTVSAFRAKAAQDFGGERVEYQMRSVSYLAERLISAWIFCNMSPFVSGRNVAVVHYNTPRLLGAAIRSLMKHTPGCHVYVFDNSDAEPFKTKMPNVEVIDNTKGQLIDFDKELAAYPDKWERDVQKSNYGSAKHTMSVDKLMELVPDGFVLMDSDVLFMADISTFWDESMACVGAVDTKQGVPLLQPFLCWLNVPVLREKGIRYYNGDKMWALSEREPDCHYDTGAWLLEDVRRNALPVRYVNIRQYVSHFSHGSWRSNAERVSQWLDDNERLWK